LLAAMIGCASSHKPTQKELATRQWNAARAGVLAGLAKDQFDNGNFDKCRVTLDEALRLNPDNASLHILSAKVGVEKGQLELAERELKQARTLDPKSAEAEYLSGVVCQRWQQPAAACEFYSHAMEKCPSELSYVLAKAEMLVAMDRTDEAL